METMPKLQQPDTDDIQHLARQKHPASLLTYDEAERFLGCSRALIKTLAAEGEIQKVQVGRIRVGFTLASLIEYVKRHSLPSDPI
jgi:predicted DNA-binding transcriptional regulator AlpA